MYSLPDSATIAVPVGRTDHAFQSADLPGHLLGRLLRLFPAFETTHDHAKPPSLPGKFLHHDPGRKSQCSYFLHQLFGLRPLPVGGHLDLKTPLALKLPSLQPAVSASPPVSRPVLPPGGRFSFIPFPSPAANRRVCSTHRPAVRSPSTVLFPQHFPPGRLARRGSRKACLSQHRSGLPLPPLPFFPPRVS